MSVIELLSERSVAFFEPKTDDKLGHLKQRVPNGPDQISREFKARASEGIGGLFVLEIVLE